LNLKNYVNKKTVRKRPPRKRLCERGEGNRTHGKSREEKRNAGTPMVVRTGGWKKNKGRTKKQEKRHQGKGQIQKEGRKTSRVHQKEERWSGKIRDKKDWKKMKKRARIGTGTREDLRGRPRPERGRKGKGGKRGHISDSGGENKSEIRGMEGGKTTCLC